jgi:hypothetical protein
MVQHGGVGAGRTDEPQTNPRLTVAQAAAALGISEGAVRSRIKRGTLATVREGGRVFVALGSGTAATNQPPNTAVPADHTAELIATLREQLEAERDANRENRRIIAALTSRIPELEPASSSEPRESPTAGPEEPERAEPRPSTGGAQEPAQPRSWWRRVFGG